MFSEEELINDGLTPEEAEMFMDTLAMSETINIIPDDVDGFLKKCDEKIPAGTAEGMKAIFEYAEKDPEFFKQLVALNIALGTELNNKEVKVNIPTLDGLSDEEYRTAKANYFSTLSKLTNEDRTEFLKLITNLTPEQKSDMIERLKG